jgi:cation:H+ antiporter
MVVSLFAALDGSPGIALGNAYGSNITNIALILGLAAVIHPVSVDSKILRKELPVLTGVTFLAGVQAWDGVLTRTEAGVLLAAFSALVAWSIREGVRRPADAFAEAMEHELEHRDAPIGRALLRLGLGFAVLLGSSRLLVWGAVRLARGFGVDDLVVGLTVVAVGTSLPELASSVAAARKKEHDIALGNVLGSNLFNTLAVVGIAAMIRPMTVSADIFSRDIPVMGLLTLSLFVIGAGIRRRPGRIDRFEGALLLLCYAAYTIYLVSRVYPPVQG